MNAPLAPVSVNDRSTPDTDSSLGTPTPPEPGVSVIELERLRREVKARLFGSAEGPVTIGRYVVLDCIGSGGMGIIYAARDERLGRTVAIKLLKPELSDNRASNLDVEAQSLAKLAHPNVVAVFDVGEHAGQRFVAMEYVEGQNLRRWLERRPSLAETLEVFRGAGEGLAAAHRAGLVHRDFKPDNVLVGVDGRPRILDFGLARAPETSVSRVSPPAFADNTEATATSLSRHGVLLGTPAYMAPEQHLGERADARSDQFGYCVALYQAVFGHLPFPTDDLRALSLAIVSGRITPPPRDPRIPESLRTLLRRGLAVDPDARFPDMQALLSALASVRADLEPGRAHASNSAARPIEIAATEPQTPTPAPTQTPSAATFDTRAIHRAFGVHDGSPSMGRPTLSESEVREIAEEVGLDLSVPPPTEAPPTRALASRPDPRDFGLVTELHGERHLPALPGGETRRRIVRELEQNLEGAGMVEHYESGMAWSNRFAEASIDRRPDGGALLTLRRSLARAARKRRRRGIVFGFLAGSVVGGILTDIPFWLGFMEPLVVFGSMGLGVLLGLRVAKIVHDRAVEEERRKLEWVGDRVGVLVEAERA